MKLSYQLVNCHLAIFFTQMDITIVQDVIENILVLTFSLICQFFIFVTLMTSPLSTVTLPLFSLKMVITIVSGVIENVPVPIFSLICQLCFCHLDDVISFKDLNLFRSLSASVLGRLICPMNFSIPSKIYGQTHSNSVWVLDSIKR